MSVFAEEIKSVEDMEMKYVVLKMKDSIDIDYLIEKLQRFKKLGREDYCSDVAVRMIAPDLINAILRNK